MRHGETPSGQPASCRRYSRPALRLGDATYAAAQGGLTILYCRKGLCGGTMMVAMGRILVIDDDVELCHLVEEYLRAEGLTVECVHDGESGLKKATAGDYLLAVLDVMLPGINGFEVLRRIRATSRLPVLLLTARGEDVDRIVGLEIGAADYLPKPFNPRELGARFRAVLRRSREDSGGAAAAPEVVSVGDVELAPATRTVRLKGKPVDLTSGELNLSEGFLREAGRGGPGERRG